MSLNLGGGLFNGQFDFDDEGALTSDMLFRKARDNTQVLASANYGSGGASTFYTVPAGKTAYIVQVLITAANTNALSASQAYVLLGTGGAFRAQLQVAAQRSGSISPSYSMPIKCEAGTTAYGAGVGTGQSSVAIVGWLE